MVPSSATPLAGSMRKSAGPHGASVCLIDHHHRVSVSAGRLSLEITLEILARLRPFPKQIGPVSVILGGLVSPIELIPQRSRLRVQGGKTALAVTCDRAGLPAANEEGHRLLAAHTDSVSLRHPAFERWKGKLKPTRAGDNSDLPRWRGQQDDSLEKQLNHR